MSAMHAMLGQVITRKAYDHMLAMADRLVSGLRQVIEAHGLPWHVSHVGARVEFVCAAQPPRNGNEARAAMDHDLESAIHLYLTNRGILLAPFHNMMLLSPVTQSEQVDRLLHALDSCIAQRSEAVAFFAENPDIDSVEMIYTDMGGVPRGKRLRQHEVLSVYEIG
eukprot:gene38159-61608_t